MKRKKNYTYNNRSNSTSIRSGKKFFHLWEYMTVNVDASMRTRIRSIWKQVQPFSLTYALTKAHIQSPWSNNQWLVIARWTACTFYVWYLPRYANMTVIMLIQFHSLHRIALHTIHSHQTYFVMLKCTGNLTWFFSLVTEKKVSLDFSLQTNNRNRYSCEINILSCGSKWRWKFPISSFVWQKK